MSDVEEFQAVDVLELEEEEALSDDDVIPELGDDPDQGEVARRPLVPLDRRGASKVRIGDEFRLRNNYDILPSVLLHFQNPITLETRNVDIVIYKRMLLARDRLPFSEIAQELVLYLGVSPSQITPNAWRYLFVSFILWCTVLEARMTISEFFNVYRVNYKRDGVVEFTVRENPIFIYLSPSYSNNGGWRSEFFRVSGEWESAAPLAEDQRMSLDWRPLQIDLREAPVLNATGRRRVATMLTFSQTPVNVLKIDYDNIVTDENMRRVLKYQIPTGKVWYDRKGKTMVRKTGSEVAATPRAKTSGTAPRSKKSVKPTADTSQLKVAKPTTNTRPGDRTPAIPAKVPILRSRSTDASDNEVSTKFALTAPPNFAKLSEDSAEASRTEVPPALPEYHPARFAPAPDSNMIEIGDEPEEPEKKDPLVQSASKRKGKEKVQGSPKRARFATDPTEYALTRASEAKLLFGRPRLILPAMPITQEVPAKPSLLDSSTSVAAITVEPLG
jgi:hypothetical protein